METKKVGHIQLVEVAGKRAVLDIGLPPGTPLKAAPHVVARIDELILKLTACPCNSGVDIHIRDVVTIPQVNLNEQVPLGG